MPDLAPRYPVKVSANGRYIVDQDDRAVFWLATTQWELFRGYSLEDAVTIIEASRAAGFTFIQTKLLGGGDGTRANVYGEKPFRGDDHLTPNEAYFRNVDAVLAAAREDPLGASAAVIGEVGEGEAGSVRLRTGLGTTRPLLLLAGDQLPRIC